MVRTAPCPLVLPALKAHMGDWNYYVAFMRFADVVERVHPAEHIHTARSLQELLQRGLTARAPEIAEYLLKQPQRFFNAIVVGTYGGHPQWHELSLKAPAVSTVALPEYVGGALGLLVLDGTETLFAIDGQHRIVGIQQALRADPDMADEEVAAIFVKGVAQAERGKDPKGFERTRRLFATLNSRGKPVGKRDIIALDEDDVIAIVTRELVEAHPLFRDKVDSSRKNKGIGVQNKTALTTLIALYDALDDFFAGDVQKLPGLQRRRPNDRDVSRFVRRATSLYDRLTAAFPALRELQESQVADQVAGRFRTTDGGHLLFRPIGFTMIHRVLRRLVDSGVALDKAIKKIAGAPLILGEEPWIGLLWDNVNRRMTTAPENQRIAEKILYHGLGGSLDDYGTSGEAVRKEWAGLTNRPPREAPLQRFRRGR